MSPKIFLIRHAEKPDEMHAGVSPSGAHNEKDLTVRGWQRDGALAGLFAPIGGLFKDSALATPQFLFASHSSSNRPRQTLLPLAEKLGIAINMEYGKGDEDRLAARAKACGGVVLISWQHEYMAAVANAVIGDQETAPQQWPKDRFDVVWVFDWLADCAAATGMYRFTQLAQRLLAGDSPHAFEVVKRTAAASQERR